MQPKISLKRSLFIVSIVGVVFSSVIIFFLIFDLSGQGFYKKPASLTRLAEASAKQAGNQAPQSLVAGASVESTQSAVSSEQAGLGLPTRLKIPKIQVDAALEPVGLTSDGSMDIPKGPVNAAWFDLGPRPGEKGSAVIAGHYGWKDDIPAVFDNLYKLQKGDKLYVEDEKGVATAFVVVDRRSYDPKAEASSVFGSSDGKAHLNLITCEGVWNEVSKSYSKRLVVFTDKEME